MTVKERANPDTINGSRRKRIASGSGTSVPDEVNKILKQYKQMQTAMKKFGGIGAGGMKNFSKMQSLMSKLKG
jgi:signal recognition particle subunit SRP54